MATQILCIAGPTASGKSARAVEEALIRSGEIISVDSRQVYRGLDIGTEKITAEEMRGVPHHLINIREVDENYSAGDFVKDASRLIEEIYSRGKLPILVGGTHFYFDALLNGLPDGVDANPELREKLEKVTTEELYAQVVERDPRRAEELDPNNRRRLIRALEIIESFGHVPPRSLPTPPFDPRFNLGKYKRSFNPRFDLGKYEVEWTVIDPPKEELRKRIDARLAGALDRGLIEEVKNVREKFGDARLNELGLEYKIVGEYLSCSAKATQDAESFRNELLRKLSAKLWHYARRQKAWLRKLSLNATTPK